MELIVGDLKIKSDGSQFTLFIKKKPEGWEPIGYFVTLERILKEALNKKALNSHAQTLNELLTELREYRKLVEREFSIPEIPKSIPVPEKPAEKKMMRRKK